MTKACLIVVLAFFSSIVVHSTRALPASRSAPVNSRDLHDQVIHKPLTPCGPVFFRLRSSGINENHRACFDEVALWLNGTAKQYRLVIDGHRDSVEPSRISVARARVARRYLVKEKGIDPGRLIVRDFSDTCPHESSIQDLNRRVEFWYLPDAAGIDSLFEHCAPAAKPTFKRRD